MLSLIISAIRLSAAFLFGSTGEIITEKSGHLNLGIPGIMCVGAAGGCLGESIYLQSLNGNYNNISWFLAIFIPLLFTLLFSGLIGLLFSFLTVTLQANQNITGLSITTFGIGLAKFIMTSINTEGFTKAAACYRNLFTFYDKLGWFGQIFMSYGILVYLAIIIAIATTLFLKKTTIGLKLRAVGESPATADAAGINVANYRYFATIIGAGISGMGGLFFIMDYLGGNWEYVIDALGWLAVAIVIFTIWRPDFAILGSIIFAMLYIMAGFISVPLRYTELIKMLPYVVTILVLIITSIVGHKAVLPPASLGISYFREER